MFSLQDSYTYSEAIREPLQWQYNHAFSSAEHYLAVSFFSRYLFNDNNDNVTVGGSAVGTYDVYVFNKT